MKDPKRIPKIIKKLKKVWKDNPDLRFCQLISSIAVIKDKTGGFYYLQDDQFEEAIDTFAKKLDIS